MTYDLNNIANIANINVQNMFKEINSVKSKETLQKLNINSKEWSLNNKLYNILKYDKNFLNYDVYESIGLAKSIILNDKGEIVSFSPPKSVEYESFINTYPVNNCYGEEYIEGTMMNMFYDPNSENWEIATKGTIGGKVSYFVNNNEKDNKKEMKTFRTMFLEAANNANFEFDILNKNYCYSFVLQHPENRIVCPIRETSLYLVAVYEIDNTKFVVNEMARSEYTSAFENTTVRFPEVYEMSDFLELGEKFASMNTSYDIMGIVYKVKDSGVRCSLLNPNYCQVKQLRGNQPKLQYTYLALRQGGKVKEYLKYYPEHKFEFSVFREQLHIFTSALHNNYVQCFVFKRKKLGEYPKQYKHHMYVLHNEFFLAELREKNEKVTMRVVIDYINNLHPAKLMYVLNYHMRKSVLDHEALESSSAEPEISES
jgi:hypothetical protein